MYDITPETRLLVEDLTGRFTTAYCREDAWKDYDRMMSATNPTGRSSAYNHRKNELVKKLCACDLDCSMLSSPEELRQLISRMPTREEMERDLYEALFQLYARFPTAGDFMTRTVRRLADPDFRGDPVRLAIAKQFYRHANHGIQGVKKLVIAHLEREHPEIDTSALGREDIIRYMTEDIFTVLNQPMTADEWEKYELIQIADDLASGKFRTYGKTKRFLYLFAMVFGMRSYTGPGDPAYDPTLDVEKNLFRDYYTDNLLRYITQDYRSNASAYEREPSGEGINYKNFAEVIYLYYLNREDLNPRKKITEAKAMIDRCAKRARRDHLLQSPDQAPREYSEYYHRQFLAEVCALTPDKLEDYICANYVFPDNLDKLGAMMAESQHRSAAAVYDRVLANVLERTDPETLAEINYDLDITLAMEDFEEDESFSTLISKLNEILTIRFTDYPVSGTENESKITRTALLVLCAWDFQSKGLARDLSLPQLLSGFRRLTDPLLEEARFQKLSETNILDMFIVAAMYHQENYNPPAG